jgi:sRNA-binding regulator protein Hfq
MPGLDGFNDYMKEQAERSALEELCSQGTVVWHLYGPRLLRASLGEHSAYELTLLPEEGEPLTLHKTQIRFLHAPECTDGVAERVKTDSEIRARKLEPIRRAGERHIVKNKTLYVLMRERTVVTCTLLEGDVLRGLIGDFTRYEMVMHLKGGVPVTVLRHAILGLRDKQGRCLLKATQDRCRDWKKSSLYHTA